MKKYVLSGFGRMGKVHKQVADAKGWLCVGLADPQFRGGDKDGVAHGAPTAGSLSELEFGAEPDVIILASTTPARMIDLDWALRHPSEPMIVAEKPFANTVEKAYRFRDLARQRTSPIIINHQRGYFPVYRLVREMISERRFGKLVGINVVGFSFGLANNATHWLELSSLLYNAPPVTVRGWLEEETIPNPRGPSFEDHVGSLLVEFGNQERLFIDFRSVLGHGISAVLSFEHANIVVDEWRGKIFVDARRPEYFDLPSWKYAPESDYSEIMVGTEAYADSMSLLYGRVDDDEWRQALDRAVWAVEGVVAGYVSDRFHSGEPVAIASMSAEHLSREFPWA